MTTRTRTTTTTPTTNSNTTTTAAKGNTTTTAAKGKGKGKATAAPVVTSTAAPAPVVTSTAAPAPVVTSTAAPAPVVVAVSTVKVPARGRSYTYPALRGKVTAATVLDAMLSGGATLADMTAALIHFMPDNYAALPRNATNKVRAHVSFLRKHGAIITETGGVFHCPDAKAVQTMARGGN